MLVKFFLPRKHVVTAVRFGEELAKHGFNPSTAHPALSAAVTEGVLNSVGPAQYRMRDDWRAIYKDALDPKAPNEIVNGLAL